MVEILTPDELQALLAKLLAGVAGGSEATWKRKLGPVTKLPIHTNIRSNWAIEPTGKAADLEAIAKAADVVRGAHPYVAE